MESELSCVVDALPGLVWTAFPDGRIDFLNQRWREYTGVEIERCRGRGWQAAIHPQDLSALLTAWQGVPASNAPVETEARVRGSDGQYRWFLFRAHPSADASGEVVKWCGLSTDIDHRRQAEDAIRTLLAAEKRLLDMVASGRPMSDVLETLCRLVESVTSGCYCSIVLVDPSGTKLQEAIAPSLAAEFNDAVRGWPLDRLGGPCQTAARDKTQVIMSDVVSDTRWRNGWRALAQAHGLRSCWSTPMVSQAGKVLGTFALYQRKPGSPDPLQLELISQFTNIASITIERAQRDDALRQSQNQLAEAERELQLTIDTIPMLVATYRPDGSRIFVNQTWRDYTGLTLDTATGAEQAGLVHPDDAARLAQEWRASLAAGTPLRTEARLRRADGVYRWHAIQRALPRDEAGTIAKWYNVAVDIDERKRAEDALRTEIAERQRVEVALRESERDLRSIVDGIPGFVAILAPNGYIETVNRRLLEYCGCSLEELRKWATNGIIHHEDLPHVAETLNKSIASGVPYDIEHRMRRHDGVYLWLDNRGIPVRNDAGEIVRWYVLLTDIEDEKHAEEARRESAARLAAAERDLQVMIDTIPVFVAAYEPDGTRSFVNRRWQEYMGLTRDEATGPDAKIFPHFHPDDAERNDEAWRASLASGDPLSLQVRVRRADGQYRWHTSHRVPLRDEKGNIVRWYSIGTDIDDQKVAEDALRRSEARLAKAERELQVMIDTIPAFVTVFGPDGQREYVNKTWRDNTGLQLADIQHGHWTRIVHPDDQERSERLWREALATGEPLKIEQRIRRNDGQYRWHMGRRVPLRDESGSILRWYSVAIDIEDQKRAEEALRESEAQLKEAQRELQLTIDSIPVLVATYRPDGARIFVNQTWRSYTGLTQEEVTGAAKTAFPHFHPDDAGPIEHNIRASLASGEPLPYEVRLRGSDGKYRWHSVRRVPLRDESGAIIRWYSTGFDIQDRKIAEEAWRQSEARLVETERELRLTLDSIPTITWRGAANGYVEQLNKRWFEYTGTTPEQVRGWRWKLCVHPDDLDRLVNIGTEYVATGTPIDCEARLRRFDGEYRWFLFRPAPVRDGTGKVVAWYGSITDIEDRKQAEGAQRESEARLFEAERELRRTLDSIPTMTWRAAPNGYVEQINKQAFDYTGKTADEMAGHRWQHVVHPDDLPGLIAAGNVNVPAGRPLDYEARLRRSDGEYRWFLFRLAPSRDEIGTVIAWYGSIMDIEDRKRAEQALQQSEAQLARAERELRLTLDSIPTMTWRSAPNGYVQQLNKQFFDYTGTAPEQVQGKGWQSVVHPDDLQPLLEIGNAYVASGIPVDYEARVRRFDGTYRWFLFRPAPARDEQGNIIAWFGSVTDIEDRKRAEDKALEAERELQRTIDHIPVLVGTYTADGKRFFANKRALEVTGLSVEDVPTERWWKAFHPDDVEPVESQWRACVASGEPFEREVRTHMADGTYRWHLTRRVPLRDETGRVIRWYGISYDIDDRKRAEEELRRSETLLAEGQRLSSTGTFSWRVDTNVVTFSRELHRIFEFDLDAPVTLGRLREQTHPEDRAIMDEKVNDVRAGRDISEIDIRLRMPDGRIKYLRILGRLIRRQDGRLEFLGAIQDVTQSRNAEEALDKIRSELAHVTRVMSLGALTASIAHEVNQPLAGIVTNASTCLRMLAADPPNVDGARETARRTIRDGNRAADVIARLRALFSKKAAVTETVDLNDATREVLALAFGDLLRNRVIARVELDDDHPLLVTGDRVQLQQVILNLVRNALDAMSEVNDRPRNLLVKADEEEEGRVRLIVRDTGVGFQPQGPERLFDAFYSTKDDGMGIGLSVSRSIIESHGGRLWAEPNEGAGATFLFSIPRQTTSAGDESTIWTRPTRGALDPTRNA